VEHKTIWHSDRIEYFQDLPEKDNAEIRIKHDIFYTAWIAVTPDEESGNCGLTDFSILSHRLRVPFGHLCIFRSDVLHGTCSEMTSTRFSLDFRFVLK
jgi:predicted 2-oxoglutarate/Fe(II)-dependent dioxygenase YbiX